MWTSMYSSKMTQNKCKWTRVYKSKHLANVTVPPLVRMWPPLLLVDFNQLVPTILHPTNVHPFIPQTFTQNLIVFWSLTVRNWCMGLRKIPSPPESASELLFDTIRLYSTRVSGGPIFFNSILHFIIDRVKNFMFLLGITVP